MELDIKYITPKMINIISVFLINMFLVHKGNVSGRHIFIDSY